VQIVLLIDIKFIFYPTFTTGIHGIAESDVLSAQAGILSAQPLPRGSSRHSALGTVRPAKSSMPRAPPNPLGTSVPHLCREAYRALGRDF
jgi:hypothetical protein